MSLRLSFYIPYGTLPPVSIDPISSPVEAPLADAARDLAGLWSGEALAGDQVIVLIKSGDVSELSVVMVEPGLGVCLTVKIRAVSSSRPDSEARALHMDIDR